MDKIPLYRTRLLSTSICLPYPWLQISFLVRLFRTSATVIAITTSVSRSLRTDHNLAERLLPLGVRRDIAIVLKCRMNDAPFIRIHRFQLDRASRPLHLTGNISRENFQCFPASCPLVLGIRLDMNIGFYVFVYYK